MSELNQLKLLRESITLLENNNIELEYKNSNFGLTFDSLGYTAGFTDRMPGKKNALGFGDNFRELVSSPTMKARIRMSIDTHNRDSQMKIVCRWDGTEEMLPEILNDLNALSVGTFSNIEFVHRSMFMVVYVPARDIAKQFRIKYKEYTKETAVSIAQAKKDGTW